MAMAKVMKEWEEAVMEEKLNMKTDRFVNE